MKQNDIETAKKFWYENHGKATIYELLVFYAAKFETKEVSDEEIHKASEHLSNANLNRYYFDEGAKWMRSKMTETK